MKKIEQVVIGLTLNYRDATRTSRCLASLFNNGVQKVLVWDNSEDHGTSSEELRQLWAGDLRVDIVVSPCNLGFAIGVNRGIEAILHHHSDAWVILINNDAVLRPGGLARLVEALQQNPQAVIAYPRISHPGRDIGTAYYQRFLALLSFDKPMPGSFPYPSGCVMLIAPERAEIPLFDEDFFMYGEDAMLGWRLGAQRMAYVPEVLVDHEGSATSSLGSEFYETRVVAGHWILARKLARNPAELVLLTLGRTLSLTARAVVRSWRYRSALPMRALWQGWKLATCGDPALLRAKTFQEASDRDRARCTSSQTSSTPTWSMQGKG